MIAAARHRVPALVARHRLPSLLSSSRGLKVAATDLRKNMFIAGPGIGQPAGRFLRVEEFTKGKAGKGGGYVQVTMRDIKNNNTVTHKFSSDERVDTVEVDKPTMYTLLYREDDVVHLMEEETFEQIEMPIALLDKEQQRWLHDGMAVKVNKYEGQPLFVTPASRATFTVAESPPAKSGENLKAAVLDNGEKIRVPTYVEVGQRVVVNTTDGTFSARADD